MWKCKLSQNEERHIMICFVQHLLHRITVSPTKNLVPFIQWLVRVFGTDGAPEIRGTFPFQFSALVVEVPVDG